MSDRITQLDKDAGLRVKAIRKSKKMSQTDLGNLLGITYQQIQKYESGANAMTVSRIYQIAEALDIDTAVIIPSPESGVDVYQLMRTVDRLNEFKNSVEAALNNWETD